MENQFHCRFDQVNVSMTKFSNTNIFAHPCFTLALFIFSAISDMFLYDRMYSKDFRCPRTRTSLGWSHLEEPNQILVQLRNKKKLKFLSCPVSDFGDMGQDGEQGQGAFAG